MMTESKAKPKAKGTSRASKPRKSATKSKSAQAEGQASRQARNPLPGSSTSGSATWGIGAGRPWPACGR